ncbi:hypothetical protein EI94DRAFT_1709976 [Lactarius quietus]|nr:hypothetical protein EI94DRAFT_1709976 [Lactarius quietus]
MLRNMTLALKGVVTYFALSITGYCNRANHAVYLDSGAQAAQMYEIDYDDHANLTYLFCNNSWGSCDLPHITAILGVNNRSSTGKMSLYSQKIISQVLDLLQELPSPSYDGSAEDRRGIETVRAIVKTKIPLLSLDIACATNNYIQMWAGSSVHFSGM